MAALAGGNVRVGLEDNLYVGGRAGDQRQLVERAASVVTAMDARLIGPQQVRDKLKLVKR